MLTRLLALFGVTAAVAAGAIALPGTASAYCDSAQCVPNVARNVVAGWPCAPNKYFAYGLDSAGGTLICASTGLWTPTWPLVGLYDASLPCPVLNQSAQGSDGVPFVCADMGGELRWAHRPDVPG